MNAPAPASDFVVRPMVEADASFVLNAWCRSYQKIGCAKHANAAPLVYDSGGIQKSARPSSTDVRTYMAEQHALIVRIMERPTGCALIACNPDDTDQIVGFLCFERPRTNTAHLAARPTYHYAYTKELFRRRGIARALIGIARGDDNYPEAWFTHWSPHASALMHPLAITYNEYLR